MDESPDDLTIKELLETYFRVEDLQKVLKSFELPFVGRKPELFERVVSLLNRRQYESEFITKVKRKVTQIYRQRVAPEVDQEMGRKCSKNWNKINNKRNKSKKLETNKKVKKKRYEDDDSYEESSDSDSTTDSSLESSSDKSSTQSSLELELISKKNKNNEIENKSKKRKRVIVSSSDESNETIDKESDNSFESSSNESKNKTQKQKIKNNVINKNEKSSKTNKITKSKKKIKSKIVCESSDSESSSDSSDSDVVQKRTVKKKFLNINLSSDSEDNDSNHNNNNNNNSSNTEPNNTNTDINNSVNNIEINNSESDDEIQILQIIPASEASNRRLNTTQMKSYSGYHSIFKDSSSSDTESSIDFNFNDEETQDLYNNINDLDKNNPSLVIGASFINTMQTCDSISEMTPQNNEIPSNSGNNINQLSNDNTNQFNNASQSFKETTNQIIESFQLTNQTLPQLSLNTDAKIEVKSEKIELKAETKTEEKRPIFQQLPSNIEQTPKLRIINTPPISYLENSPKMAETVSIRIISPTDTINFIKKRMNASGTSEVEAIDQSFKLSLICPITNKRIGLPGRSLQCQHIDCFDINTFIQLSSCKAMTLWKCPKCKLPANLPVNRNGISSFNANNIIIDGLIKHILSITDSSCDAVIFDNKAIWSPDIKNSDNYSNKAIKNEVVLLDNTTEIIELDDDSDETPIDKVTSEIANAKSYANNTSNMLITQKQGPVFNRTNPQIERIVEFLQSGSVEPQMSSPAQNIQNVSQNQTLQTQTQSLLKPTEQQNRTHFLQQQQQIQKQNTIASHQKYPTFHRNTDIQNRAPIPYTTGPQMDATHSQINSYRTNAINQNPVVNDLSQSTAATNSSDHIKFEYDSGGLIKAVFCHICNVEIPVGTKNIEIHCNGEQHRRLKLSYNKIPNNNSQNRPQNRPLVQSTNQMMSSFHPRAGPSSQMNAQQTGYHNYNSSHNSSHSTNTTFQTPQYYTTQYQRYPNQVSQPMNPYYSQPRPQYQPSMPLPAHQTQSIPPAAHMTSQNTSQFTQMPNSYRSVAHYNQTYNPYNYS